MRAKQSRARLSQIADSIGESWLHLKRAGAAVAGFTYAEAVMCHSSLFRPLTRVTKPLDNAGLAGICTGGNPRSAMLREIGLAY